VFGPKQKKLFFSKEIIFLDIQKEASLAGAISLGLCCIR
jgi:hypothetical protein